MSFSRLADRPYALDSRPAFLFGLLMIFLLGAIVRVPRFADTGTGLLFTVMADAVVALLLLVNGRLQRWAWSVLRTAEFLAVLVASSLASSVVVFLTTSTFQLLHPALRSPYQGQATVQIVYFWFIFLAWGVALAWLLTKSETGTRLLQAAAAERAAIVAEMRRLRTQLDPHFLFNALNTIAVEIRDQPQLAEATVHELSQYLRYSLDTADQALVRVTLEVMALRSFLRVQKARFGQNLRVHVRLGPGTRRLVIPAFLLQPLVENATKHGRPGVEGVLEISASITRQGDRLVAVIVNTGELTESNGLLGTGTGLTNLGKRLELHYPGRHGFHISEQKGLVRAELWVRGAPC
jgi:two-component system LytT family sensor kinase